MGGRASVVKVLQARFTEKGSLLVQKTLNYISPSNGSKGCYLQETLDKWLHNTGDNPLLIHEDILYDESDRSLSYVDDELSIDDEEWDGSIDNAEKTLEEHVSKYGWMF